MFKCCLDQQLDIEMHHIVPQEEGRSDDIENAAPLCPTCHERYDNDPRKRKRIIEARDDWYERVENMYPDNRSFEKSEDISNKLDKLLDNQIAIDDFRSVLKQYSDEAINNMTLGTAVTTALGIANASVSPSPSPFPSPEIDKSD